MKPGAWWPVAMVGVLGLTVAANLWLLLAASDPQATVVEPDYYRRALQWDSTSAVVARSRRLGWSAEAAIGRLDRQGRGRIEVLLRDSSGVLVRDARVRVIAIHNLDAGRHLEAALAVDGAVHAATLPLGHAGRWELRIDARRGADHFVTRLRCETGGSGKP